MQIIIMACIGGVNHLKRIPAHIIDQIGYSHLIEGNQFRMVSGIDFKKESFILRPRHIPQIQALKTEWYTIGEFFDYDLNSKFIFARHEDLSKEEFDEWCFEILNDNREKEIT